MPDKKEAFPTQQFIEIASVRKGTAILKNGGLRQVVMVSGINFDLKSEEEQNAIIGSFQGFLNSLNFAIQIVVHSRKVNIDRYLEMLSQREIEESNSLLKNQITEYREFIKSFVSENAIMDKTYFVVVSFDPIKLPQAPEELTQKIFGFLKRKGVAQPTERMSDQSKTKEQQLDEHIEQISRRTAQVVESLNQIDLRAVPLNDEELTELYYNLYNPEAVEKKGLALAKIR